MCNDDFLYKQQLAIFFTSSIYQYSLFQEPRRFITGITQRQNSFLIYVRKKQLIQINNSITEASVKTTFQF